MKNYDKKGKQILFKLISLFAIIALIIIIAGYFYYKSYENQYLTGIKQQLKSGSGTLMYFTRILY